MRHKLLAVLVGGVVAAAAAGGIAWATIPGDGNVYTACMLKNVGTLRLIDKSLPSSNLMSHCTGAETEVSWNQLGQQGPQGPSGPQGVPGRDGAAGKDGVNGANGADGVSVTSAVEPAGANCANGGSKFTAANGVTYACDGSQGPQGPQGPKGDAGPQGPQGAEGPQGPAGTGAATAWATVAFDGTKLAGTSGLQTQKLSTGLYGITVPFAPQACAVVATTDEGSNSVAAVRKVISGNGFTVSTFRDWNAVNAAPGLADSGFSLVIVC